MMLNLLKGKIHCATVTEANLQYMGSITIDEELMEKAGIITGYHSSINMEKIGFHVKAFIQVQLEPRQKQEFYPYIQSIPNVIECNCVTGDYSEIMEVVFPSTTNLDDFINTIQQRFGKTSTQIVFSTSVNHRGVKLAAPQDDDDK